MLKAFFNTESDNHIGVMVAALLIMGLLMWSWFMQSDINQLEEDLLIAEINHSRLSRYSSQYYKESRDKIEKLDKELSQLESNKELMYKELSHRLQMLSSEVMELRIEVDEVSHEGCDSNIQYLWEELEYLRRMVK